MAHIPFNEEIPVTYEVDVAVAGGGPAGVAAAFKAAACGKSVLIIEQMNCLGGIATAGWHGHICCYSAWDRHAERVVGGTCYDVALRVVKEGYGTFNGVDFDFDVERLKLVLENMAKESKNIKILYYTQVCDTVVENGRIQYVVIQNKSGRQAVKAKMVVDSTGDADVAAKSGVPFEYGRPQDHAVQPMTLMFQIGGHEHEPFQRFRDEGYRQKYGKANRGEEEVWRQAQANGDMEPFQTHTMGWWWCKTKPDQIGANFTHIAGKNPTSAEDLTDATIEGRRQAYLSMEVFKKYIPGMENAWLSHTAALIGTRESRRIIGEYYITAEDLMREKEFEDSIGYGSFYIDVHNCTDAGMDGETYYPRKGFKYQIPYRALVPQKIDNLLVAGRCISCEHLALGSLRVMPQCFLEGDAAGVAASLAIENNLAPKEVSVAALQAKLREFGAVVTKEDIVIQST